MKKKKIYFAALILFLLDQISKLIIHNYLKNPVVIIKNFFRLNLLQNTGAAFGLFEDARFFLIMITAAVLVLLAKMIKEEKDLSKLSFWIYSLILGGIIGNFFDRIVRGHVIDFLSFKLFNNEMPIFNFADSFIVIGAILIIVDFIKELYENNKQKK